MPASYHATSCSACLSEAACDRAAQTTLAWPLQGWSQTYRMFHFYVSVKISLQNSSEKGKSEGMDEWKFYLVSVKYNICLF